MGGDQGSLNKKQPMEGCVGTPRARTQVLRGATQAVHTCLLHKQGDTRSQKGSGHPTRATYTLREFGSLG